MTDTTSNQKISKDIDELNSIMNQPDIINIYKIIPIQHQQNKHFSQSPCNNLNDRSYAKSATVTDLK